MLRRDFYFDLPPELIAQIPSAQRDGSRLMLLERSNGQVQDSAFIQFVNLLQPHDLLVFNDTKVIPARLYACKPSGGQVEILLERLLPDNQVLAHIRANRAPKEDSELVLLNGISVQVLERSGGLYKLGFPTDLNLLAYLQQYGQVPLPPYIKRVPQQFDTQRYQTVYAEQPGAVAAPTAGLHFTQKLLQDLAAQGVSLGFITLHIGAGTFQPVRSEHINDHHMHSEWLCLDDQICEQVASTQQQGGRVIAIGTTVVRSLETASQGGQLQPYTGDTDIFITPGYQFRTVDALLTNFHLPESTLLMLVAAFAGYEPTMAAYRHAVAKRYHFFSYGDAMFIY